MASQQGLDVVLRRQESRQLDPSIADKVVDEIKSSAILSVNWEDLILSAPVALSCLGACFVASSSKLAETIQVPMVAGATVQRPVYLSANLTECANLGTRAFIMAERGLLKIRMLSVNAQNTVSDVVECLAEPVMAQKYLKMHMANIQDSANQCYHTSKQIDDEFNKWLLFVQELNTACTEQKSTVTEKAVANELKKATEECRLVQTEETVKEAKRTTDQLGKTLDAATAAYNKASDNFPTGWEIIGQQVVSGLSECLTTAINQAIPALVDNMNPMAKIKAGTGILKDITGKDGKDQSQPNNGASTGNTSSGTPQIQQPPPPAVEARDPAYAQISRDLYLFDALNAILSGQGNDIDWKSAEVTKEKPKSGINFILTMLLDSSNDFTKKASDQQASVQYKQILTDSVKIAQGIADEAKKASSSLNYTKPTKDSLVVQKWQETFNTLYSNAYALNTKGRQLPGNPANPAPLYPTADPTAQINAKTQQAQVLLDGASKRLATTAETLKVTTETYQTASKQLVEQQSILANIKAELTKLTKENMALDEIKSVLVQCIKLIINLKAQITNLVRFFSAIATTVDVVVNKIVGNFLKTVSVAVSSDPTALEKGNLKIGNFSLLDAERTMIYQGSLTVSAYFSLFADLGTMWRDVSKDHIFPGIALVEQVGATTDQPSEMKKRVKNLEDWSDRAQSSIQTNCKAKREKILMGMNERVEDINSTMKELPAGTIPRQIQSVIEQTSQETEAATKKDVLLTAQNKPINRPSLSRKE